MSRPGVSVCGRHTDQGVVSCHALVCLSVAVTQNQMLCHVLPGVFICERACSHGWGCRRNGGDDGPAGAVCGTDAREHSQLLGQACLHRLPVLPRHRLHNHHTHSGQHHLAHLHPPRLFWVSIVYVGLVLPFVRSVSYVSAPGLLGQC